MPRVHRKVWLWWGRWWAVQFVWFLPEASFGFHIEPLRPLLDIYLPFVTLSIGNHPVLSDERYKSLHCGRGFVYGRWPEDAGL